MPHRLVATAHSREPGGGGRPRWALVSWAAKCRTAPWEAVAGWGSLWTGGYGCAPDAEWVLMYRLGLGWKRIAEIVRVHPAVVGYHLVIARRRDPGLETGAPRRPRPPEPAPPPGVLPAWRRSSPGSTAEGGRLPPWPLGEQERTVDGPVALCSRPPADAKSPRRLPLLKPTVAPANDRP